MRRIRGCWSAARANPGSPLASDAPVDVAAADDPVAAFLGAHDAGRPVALRTSATLGPQRTVVRTTASWISSLPTVDGLVALRPESRVWVPGPVGATMNLFAAVQAARRGARLVPSLDRATHAYLTPTVLAAGLDEGHPVAGVTLVVAGDRLSPALHDRATRAGARVHHYYGAAELSFVAWGA